MSENEFDDFTDLLDAVCSLISRGNYTPDPTNAALWFQALRAHDLALVRKAFDAHVKDPQRGRFVPTPADILGQIDALTPNGRPGVEEAWAMIPKDEDTTIVWTEEMAEGYRAAAPLLASGDRVAARMAFKEVYESAVVKAKAAGRPVHWLVSLGHDKNERKRVLVQAVKDGRIGRDQALELLPAPLKSLGTLLLQAPEHHRSTAEAARVKLDEIVEGYRADDRRAEAKGKDWAKKLRTLDQGGLRITPHQREMWKSALPERLGEGPAQQVGQFVPVPFELLPRGMRLALARERGTNDSTFDQPPADLTRSRRAG